MPLFSFLAVSLPQSSFEWHVIDPRKGLDCRVVFVPLDQSNIESCQQPDGRHLQFSIVFQFSHTSTNWGEIMRPVARKMGGNPPNSRIFPFSLVFTFEYQTADEGTGFVSHSLPQTSSLGLAQPSLYATTKSLQEPRGKSFSRTFHSPSVGSVSR